MICLYNMMMRLCTAILIISFHHSALVNGQCYETLKSPSGIIKTPNYPNNYPPNIDCYWEIMRPKDGACVVFTVESMNIDTQEEILCPGDHFALESCGSWQEISPERYYCGNYNDLIEEKGSFELVQHYQINATSLRVSFHSDSAVGATGFLMQYRVLNSKECRAYGSAGFSTAEGKDCVAILDDESGRIQSPGYPNRYPEDIACAYIFKRPTPEYCGVFLRATRFSLESLDGSICHDYFGMPGCRKTCGRASQPLLRFHEYQKGAAAMVLQFESDFSVQGSGFIMKYLQVKNCFNPYQPECPNDQLSQLASPTECPYSEYHDCNTNSECEGRQICCFDGCLRKCVNPELNPRKKRDIAAIKEFFEGVTISEWTSWYPRTQPDYKLKHTQPKNVRPVTNVL